MRAGSGVLDARQRAVDSECLCEALRALHSDLVEAEAADVGGTEVSAAADTLLTLSFGRGRWVART